MLGEGRGRCCDGVCWVKEGLLVRCVGVKEGVVVICVRVKEGVGVMMVCVG